MDFVFRPTNGEFTPKEFTIINSLPQVRLHWNNEDYAQSVDWRVESMTAFDEDCTVHVAVFRRFQFVDSTFNEARRLTTYNYTPTDETIQLIGRIDYDLFRALIPSKEHT